MSVCLCICVCVCVRAERCVFDPMSKQPCPSPFTCFIAFERWTHLCIIAVGSELLRIMHRRALLKRLCGHLANVKQCGFHDKIACGALAVSFQYRDVRHLKP